MIHFYILFILFSAVSTHAIDQLTTVYSKNSGNHAECRQSEPLYNLQYALGYLHR
jgi:hypothetical protein